MTPLKPPLGGGGPRGLIPFRREKGRNDLQIHVTCEKLRIEKYVLWNQTAIHFYAEEESSGIIISISKMERSSETIYFWK